MTRTVVPDAAVVAGLTTRGHLAHFVSELVDEVLDLSAFTDSYAVARGFPPYDPRLMVKILLYG